MTVTFVGSGMAMLVKCSLSLRVETNVRVGIWSTCFLSKCYRWKHCRIIIVVSIVASNVSRYGVIICNFNASLGACKVLLLLYHLRSILNPYFRSRSMDFGPKKYTSPKEVSTSTPALISASKAGQDQGYHIITSPLFASI